MSYVVDASVVVKLFIVEDYSDKATEIINAHAKGYISLSAPTLIVYELGNVFWKHPHITYEKAYRFIEKFLDLDINLVDVHSNVELLKTACRISESMSLTFYDASYIAIAERDKVKLITADEELHNKAQDFTLLLKDVKGI